MRLPANLLASPAHTFAGRCKTCAAIAAAALMLAWPALLNGYPLLTPDSIGYVTSGHWIVSALRHPLSHWVPDMRGEFYDLGIYFLHWDHWLWPVVACNALLTAGILWQLVRHVGRQPSRIAFLILIAVLSVTTCIGWPVSAILADAYGAPGYLALFLLIFRWEFTSRPERWLLAAVIWWGLVAHPTHWLIASALCLLLALLSFTPWADLRDRRRHIGLAAAVIAVAIGSQVLLHRLLYGKASLNGPSAPYLSARIIADGPGALYLQGHCSTLHWVLCEHVDALPTDDNGFLWAANGIWASASPADRQRLRDEERPFVLATLRAYPAAQLHQSWRNFRQQVTTFSVYDIAGNAQWVGTHLASAVPTGAASYNRSLESQGRLPVAWISETQENTCRYAALALLVLLPLAWMRRRVTMLALSLVILSAVVLNALVCGVLSGPYPRYQARVVWMVPMLAALLLWDLFQLRPAEPARSKPQPPEAAAP